MIEYPFPRIRPIEAFPIEYEGTRQMCLRDPLGICPNPVLVLEQAFFLITQFNGNRPLMEISLKFMSKFGQSISTDAIQQLVDQLDANFLMDSPRYYEEFDRLKKLYDVLPTRPAALAGTCYEAEPAALRAQLDAILGAAHENGGNPAGIIAPHIDIRLGKDSYAAAFSCLRDSDAELFVILGIAHMFSDNLFTVVAKDFETPLGTMPVDSEAVKKVIEIAGDSVLEDNFIHRNEHSIEFQALFLRHVLGPDNPAKILPVMSTSFTPLIEVNMAPSKHPEASKMIEAIKAATTGKKTCFIAGVDFAHVGQKFGDATAPDDATLADVKTLDLELTQILARRSEPDFMEHFTRDNDARRVCGLPALGLLTNTLPPSTGKLLHYGQAVEQQTGSAVSFAAMAFYK